MLKSNELKSNFDAFMASSSTPKIKLFFVRLGRILYFVQGRFFDVSGYFQELSTYVRIMY